MIDKSIHYNNDNKRVSISKWDFYLYFLSVSILMRLAQPQRRYASCRAGSNNFKCIYRQCAIDAIRGRIKGRKRRAVHYLTTRSMYRTTRTSSGDTTRMTTRSVSTTRNGNSSVTTTRSGMTTRNCSSGSVTTETNEGGTEESARQEVINLFCEYRDPGAFAFPPNCQAYVLCDQCGRATFMACKKGQHFHQETRTCVDARYLSCYTKLPTDNEGELTEGMLLLVLLFFSVIFFCWFYVFVLPIPIIPIMCQLL